MEKFFDESVQYKFLPKIFFHRLTNLILSYFNIIKQSNPSHHADILWSPRIGDSYLLPFRPRRRFPLRSKYPRRSFAHTRTRIGDPLPFWPSQRFPLCSKQLRRLFAHTRARLTNTPTRISSTPITPITQTIIFQGDLADMLEGHGLASCDTLGSYRTPSS